MTPQRQRAGEGAQQIQVSGNLIVNHGIDEERAREIAREVARSELEQFSAEAEEIGSQRVAEFHTKLVDEFASKDQLEAFADPAFQVLLKKAQLGAASSDRDSDYDLLVDLLDDRVKRGKDRHIRAGIDQAVQIVDQVDDQALLGLTVLQAMQQYSPLAGELEAGLDAMENLMSQLVDGSLPEGVDWLDHLDVLGAARVMPAGIANFNPFDDWYPKMLRGYLSPGIEEGSETASKVAVELASVGLTMQTIAHELRPGYQRIPFPSLLALERALTGPVVRSQEQIEAATRIARDEYRVDEVLPELTAPFIERLVERPSLAAMRTWWNQIPTGANITAVGRVLATANAQRLDTRKILPPLR